MATYSISGNAGANCKVRIFVESGNEYLGYEDVSSGAYEIKFRLNSSQDVLAVAEDANGQAAGYGSVTPSASAGAPTLTPPDDWNEKNGLFNASNGDKILLDASGGGFTVNLPASPVMGDTVSFVDATGDCGTNNVTVGRNGEKIMGLAEDLTINDDNAAFDLVYYNSTYGWRLRYE